MYEASFGLRSRPFPAVPRTDRYFPAQAIETARQTLARCIERGEGPGLVIGPAGTGKTLLCQLLAEQFTSTLAVAHLASGGLRTRRGLLQAILFELGQPYRGLDEGELRLALVDYLTTGAVCAQGVLLLVDEAHTLPLRLLEEVRVITNLVVGGQPRVRLVLAGAPVLEERLASPRLESFSQRLAARCYLEALHRSETQAYIEAAIRTAGGSAEKIMAAEACQAVYHATNGVPRLINQVCDHALLLAYAAGEQEVSRARIEEAWGDLQQLPTPWNGEPAAARDQGSIEFGCLEDEPAQAASPPAAAEASLAEEPSVVCVSGAAEAPLPEPIERIESIERALELLDEDFRPAGSIGPEVEVVFDESDPFSEPFEEEEIIVDRYMAVGRASGRPQPSPPDTAEAELTTLGQRCTTESVCWGPMPKTPAALWGGAPAQSPGPIPPPPARPESPATVPLRRDGPDESPEPDDSDMIVVEEGYESLAPPHVR